MKFFSFSFLLITSLAAAGQVKFSLATDLSYLRNFDGRQPFGVFGQSIHGNWHLDEKNTVYAWFSYHSNGKYKSTLMASAKSPSTIPQFFSFANNSEMKLRHLSVGIKRYLHGSYIRLEKFNLYGAAGFGLIIGTASNNFSPAVDTSLYTIENNIVNGSGDFKRLSFDITGGWEFPVGYEIFVYSEARLHIPTTDYPTSYLLKNNNAPFTGSINLGIRVLFNYDR